MINQPVQQQNATQKQEKEQIPESIHVLVRNRRQVLFDDEVKAITSRNETGLFDVLPEHSNFISVIKEKIILHKTNGEKYEILVQNGIIKVKNNSVRCYIDLISHEMK